MQIRHLIWGVIVLLVMICGGIGFSRHTYALNLEDPFTITSTGRVIQNNRTVGIFNEHDELILPLVTPQTSDQIVFTTLTFTTDQVVNPDTIAASLISIQSLSNSSTTWYGQDLLVDIGGLVPDAHTSLHLKAQPGTFSYALPDQLAHAASGLPLEPGIVMGGVLVLLTLIWLRFASPHQRWQQSALVSTPPEGISPIGLAIVHHSSLTSEDITTILYDLAQSGHLQMISRGEELLFARTSSQEPMAPYEHDLLEVLFPENEAIGHIDNILQNLNKELFSQIVSKLYLDTYGQLDANGYFEKNPRLLHLEYKTLAIVLQSLGILGVILASFAFQSSYAWIFPASAGLYLAGWLIYRSAPTIAVFSPRGSLFATECGKFVSYLRSPQPISTEGNQGFLFYEYVPYALATDSLQQWQYRFREHSFFIPGWFVDESDSLVTPELFVAKLLETSEKLSTSITAVKDPNVD